MHRSILSPVFALCCVLVACAAQVPAEDPAPVATIGLPPGAAGFDAELKTALGGALAARGAGYEPRTQHLNEDGSPSYTNRLILESSPYLNQHAHNPVNWYPWGDEAFATAARLGRPVLLSVGYSTCHWCHVMEEESFEDVEIARYLNEHYIAIKVDREQRPDIDSIYMSAVQAMTGRGGWPMTVWLTSDRKPFFGGTYFPARDGDRGAKTGFLTLLTTFSQRYQADRDRVEQFGQQMTERIRQSMDSSSAIGAMPGSEVIKRTNDFYAQNFDAVYGGTKRAPKFPSNMPIRLLLRHYHDSGDEQTREMATLTLRRMAEGGMFDQVGGGFHRYSVDARWLVPHFEKMLYDNALLTMAYLEGYQASGDEAFAGVARRVLDYVGREMTAPEGGFYSATDADSLNPTNGEAEEGWFFTWTMAELEQILGRERTPFFAAYYGATEKGNFEGRNILHVTRPVAEVAQQFNLTPERADKILEQARRRLYDERLTRPHPLRDDKRLAAWNGLMISSYARGGAVLDEPVYTERAGMAARFVLDRMRDDKGRLLRSYKDGQARFTGYLDDYAFVIAGLLDLYETTWDVAWLRDAMALQGKLDQHYRDVERGGYYMTADDADALLAREKPAYDGAEPSGNSVSLMNLLRLNELTGNDTYRTAADGLIAAFGGVLKRSPAALNEMLLGLDFLFGPTKEIVIVTPTDVSQAQPFLDELRGMFLPRHVLIVAGEGEQLKQQAAVVPLLAGKTAIKGETTAYVCEQRVCKLPTRDVKVFVEQLTARAPVAP